MVCDFHLDKKWEKKRLSRWPSFWCLFKFCTRLPDSFPSFLILVPPGQAKSFWISLIGVSLGGQAPARPCSLLGRPLPVSTRKYLLILQNSVCLSGPQSELCDPHPPSPFHLDHISCPNPCLWESRNCCSVTQLCLTLCDPMDWSTPGFPHPSVWVCSNSCPLSQWCHPGISSSVVPFPSCLQSFPASGSLQWVSSLPQVAKVLELQLWHQSFQNIQDWFPLGLTDWISLLSKGLSRVFFNTTIWRHQFFCSQPSRGCVLVPDDWCSCKRTEFWAQTHGEGTVYGDTDIANSNKTEEEMGSLLPQVREWLEFPETGEGE